MPKWSEKPLLKSWQKVKPPLGWPRETDSLCPVCVREARQEILDGKRDYKVLLTEKIGEIKAHDHRARRQDPDGQGLPDPRPLRGRDGDGHGVLQAPRGDVPGLRHARAQRREAAQPRLVDDQVRPRLGADDRPDEPLQHDVRPVLHGREPGRVRPRARRGKRSRRCSTTPSRIKPKRQMSVQFSGGEPTLSPYFLDAVRYARKVGYNSVQAATNGIEFAKSPDFARAAAEAGLRYAYLQFDGIGNAANSHRLVGNLFDVKLRAIENLWSAGVDIVPVTTIVNGVNNEQVGRIIQFALDNPQEDLVPLVPAGVVHRPRRGDHRRAPARAALHAVAPGARREEPDGPRRADARLVPDLVHGHVRRLGGPRARRRRPTGASCRAAATRTAASAWRS